MVDPQPEAPFVPDWLSLDPGIMVKAAACLTTAYEKAALRLTCKQWKWAMDQAVKEVPMIPESERPWGRPVTPQHIQRVCSTFPSLKHLDLTATADWDPSHLRAARCLQGLDLNAQHQEAFRRLDGVPAILDVQIINISSDYPLGRCYAQPGGLDTLCSLNRLTNLAFWRVDFAAHPGDSPFVRLALLRELSFSYCHIPDLLRGEAFPSRMLHLDVRGCNLGPYPLKLPRHLCSLDLSGTDISGQDLRRQISRLQNLEDLRMHTHDDPRMRSVDFLSHLTTLTRLELDRASSPGQTGPLRIARLTRLRHLDLDCSWLAQGSSARSRQLSLLGQLTLLRLRDPNWGHLSVPDYRRACLQLTQHLKSCCLSLLPTLTHLRSLHLYHLECMDEEWMRVVPLLTQLRDLDLGNAPECLLPGLARLSSLQKLTRLNLEWNNWLGDQDLGFLTHLTSLHTLSIANCLLLGAKSFRWLPSLLQLRRLDISSLNCGVAGLWELHTRGVTPRLEEFLISGTVRHFEGAPEGLQHDVLGVLAASLELPHCRLSKIVFEDLLYLHATRGMTSEELPLLIDFYQDRGMALNTKLAYLHATERLRGPVGVCKLYGTRADQKVLRFSVDSKPKSDWSFAGLKL